MSESRKYPSWQRRHEGVLIWLLENPTAKLSDCARMTGYSPSQISRIVNSPEFQRRLIERTELLIADEISLAGTLAEIVPIRRIDHYVLPIDRPISEAIANRFWAAVRGSQPHPKIELSYV